MKRRQLVPPDTTRAPRPLLSKAEGPPSPREDGNVWGWGDEVSARPEGWKGPEAENIVCRYLTDLGWRIVCQNFRHRRGEIDIVAQDGQSLVFVEVKARSQPGCGLPGEAVTCVKQQRIRQAAQYFLTRHTHSGELRFDVVTLSGPPRGYHLEHHKGAF